MFIISTFEHSIFLELAISGIEAKGIPKTNVLAAPLEVRQPQGQIFDTIHHADGISQIDGALLAAAFSSLIFTIYGSIWPGGPLIWGFLGLLAGGGVGLAIDIFYTGKKRAGKGEAKSAQVVLIIKCEENQAIFIEEILCDHLAMGIAKVT